MNSIEKGIKEHVDCLEELIKNQHSIIETQDQLIKTLKASIKTTEMSRDYWINKYYELEELYYKD